jgi:hypothetical protein
MAAQSQPDTSEPPPFGEAELLQTALADPPAIAQSNHGRRLLACALAEQQLRRAHPVGNEHRDHRTDPGASQVERPFIIVWRQDPLTCAHSSLSSGKTRYRKHKMAALTSVSSGKTRYRKHKMAALTSGQEGRPLRTQPRLYRG